MQDSVAVAVCTDEAYALYATMALRSTALNVKSGVTVEAFFVDAGVRRDSKRRAQRTLDLPNLRLHWLQPNLERIESLPISSWTSTAAHARILLPEILPDEIEWVLYIDSDMFICDDISSIWNMKEPGLAAMACQDKQYPTAKEAKSGDKIVELGMDPDDTYFNSGFLMINKKFWGKENIKQKYIEISKEYGKLLHHRNQDILNILLRDDVLILDQRWNTFIPTYSNGKLKEDIPEDPFALHFTGVGPLVGIWEHTEKRDYLRFVFNSEWFSGTTYITLPFWIALKNIIFLIKSMYRIIR